MGCVPSPGHPLLSPLRTPLPVGAEVMALHPVRTHHSSFSPRHDLGGKDPGEPSESLETQAKGVAPPSLVSISEET